MKIVLSNLPSEQKLIRHVKIIFSLTCKINHNVMKSGSSSMGNENTTVTTVKYLINREDCLRISKSGMSAIGKKSCYSHLRVRLNHEITSSENPTTVNYIKQNF